jgi:hypothetical protein
MQMVYNRSCFLDKQLMKMQENPNEIPEGETPHTVSMFARQVGSARSGSAQLALTADPSLSTIQHICCVCRAGPGGSGQAW